MKYVNASYHTQAKVERLMKRYKRQREWHFKIITSTKEITELLVENTVYFNMGVPDAA
jgi:hypothetical protein